MVELNEYKNNVEYDELMIFLVVATWVKYPVIVDKFNVPCTSSHGTGVSCLI